MRRSTLYTAAIVAALGLGACSSSATTTPAAAPTTAAPAPTTSAATPSMTTDSMATTDPMAKDIIDTAVGAGGFTTLATAVTAAGLVDTLKGPGPFTVFAPQDSAFAKLPAGTLQTLLADPKGKLTQILTYHVVAGKVMAADVVGMAGQKVKTVNGAEVTIQVSGGMVSLVDATGASVNVIKTDVTASNGVIHVLDGVLMPPA
ncbi:MAG: fasciclin domain-containing protein [Candidatus Phosphoribacter sp.]